MNPGESDDVSFRSFGLSVRLSLVVLAKLHLVHIKLQSHVVDNLSSVISRSRRQTVCQGDRLMDKQFLLNQTIKFPGSVPSL